MSQFLVVDRSRRPYYPCDKWLKSVVHPELESNGPRIYDVTKLNQWRHVKQCPPRGIESRYVYAELLSQNLLRKCIGLRDLEEIQLRGLEFYRTYFQRLIIFAWASVVINKIDDYYVPYLSSHTGVLQIYWYWFISDLHMDCPALLFQMDDGEVSPQS